MRVLVYFYNDQHWIHFRYAEFDALLRMHGLNPSDIYEKPADKGMTASSLQHSPFLIAELPSIEVAQSICKRSVLIRQILLLWDHTNNFEELASRVSACSVCNPATGVASACNSNHCHHSTDTDADINSKTFSVSIHTFGQSLSSSQKVGLRNSLPVSRFTGKVNLSNPELPVMLIMDFSSKHEFDKKAIVTPVEDINQINVAEGGEKIVYPKRVKTGGVGSQKSDDIVGVPCYFGLAIGFGGMKDEISKYDLKTRLFIGPTSLDHVLALIMSNLSYVDANSVVLDPFVGTASLLVAASHFKATCFGSDIDIRVLKGAMYAGKADRKVDKTKRDIIENFKHYGLQTPEILRLDNHLFEHHFESDHVLRGFYDAIITDPPYGIRAGARKSGKRSVLCFVWISCPLSLVQTLWV